MKRLSPLFLLFVLFTLQLSLFLYVTIRPFRLAPPGHTYTVLSKNFLYPIFFYPSMILQAKDGAWSVLDSHTTAPQKSTSSQWFFIAAGKFARLGNVEPAYLYIVLQALGGSALFAATYLFITRFLPKPYHLPAILFTFGLEVGPLTATIFSPIPAFDSQILVFRNFGLAHHIWGLVMGIISLYLLFISFQKPTLARLTGLAVIALIGTATLPPVMLIIMITVYPALLLSAYAEGTQKKLLIPLLIAAVSIGLMGLQTKIALTAASYPWNSYTAIEKTWWDNRQILLQYLRSLMLYTPFFGLLIIAIPFRWKTWSGGLRRTMLSMASWIVMPVLLIPLSALDIFPIANMRIVDGYHYMPAGILAAVGLMESVALLPSFWKKLALSFSLIGILALSLFLTTIYHTRFLATQTNTADGHAYPATTTWEAVHFLRSVPHASGILSREWFGEIIPGFANVRVYIGGTHGFPDWLDRKRLAEEFYTGTLTPTHAQQFLWSNDISYVFYGPDEKAVNETGSLYPTVLTSVFTNRTASIYRVQPK